MLKFFRATKSIPGHSKGIFVKNHCNGERYFFATEKLHDSATVDTQVFYPMLLEI